MTRTSSSIFFWLGLTIMASLMLYHTSDKVHALDQHLRKINAQIDDERKSLHVLKAEWIYLANPARIEAQAKRHLGMQLTTPSRICALRDMGDLVPTPEGVSLPVRAAEKTATSLPQPEPKKPEAVASNNLDRIVASLNAGRINDHMTMQRATPVKASTDRIGALIGSLDMHP